MKVLIVESDSCLPFYGIVQDILSTSEVRFIQLSADSIIEEVERYTLGQSNEDLVIITSIRNRNFLLAYCTVSIMFYYLFYWLNFSTFRLGNKKEIHY